MNQAQALGKVGLPDPGGDPAAQRSMAEQWYTLARQLTAHADHTAALIEQSAGSGRWQSDASSTMRTTATSMVDAGRQMAGIAMDVGQHLDEHAKHHELVLEILEQLALQIVVTLAFMAASTMVPPLLAWAEASLMVMATQGSRTLEILAMALRSVVQFLARVRAVIADLAKVAFRTEHFSLGYGKALYEGTRDFVVDLVSNATTTKIEGKQLNAADLFQSAALSFGVGAATGSVTASGIKKVLTAADAIKREADGLPKFLSFEDQYKKLVNSLDSRPPSPPVEKPVSAASGALDRLARAEKAAKEAGVWPAFPGHGSDLAADVVAADTSGDKVALDSAQHKFDAWSALRAAQDRVDQLAGPSLSLDRLTRAEAAARRAGVQIGSLAEGERLAAELLTAAGTGDEGVLTRAVQKFEAWDELHSAREQVATTAPLAVRLRHSFINNAWSQSLGKPKNMLEVVLVDGVKDTVKGVIGSAAGARIDVARGKLSANMMGPTIGLGAASAGLRGVFKSYASNRWFPKDSIEEALWRISNKGLDKLVRDLLKKYALTHG